MGAGAIFAVLLLVFIGIYMGLIYSNTLCTNKWVGHGLCYNSSWCVGGIGNCDESQKIIREAQCNSPANQCPAGAISCYEPEPVQMVAPQQPTTVAEFEPYEKA